MTRSGRVYKPNALTLSLRTIAYMALLLAVMALTIGVLQIHRFPEDSLWMFRWAFAEAMVAAVFAYLGDI